MGTQPSSSRNQECLGLEAVVELRKGELCVRAADQAGGSSNLEKRRERS